MALSKIQTGLLADGSVDTAQLAAAAVDNTIIDLSRNYTFTGTVSGAGKLLQMGEISQPGNGVTNGSSGAYVTIIPQTLITPVGSGSTFLLTCMAMNGIYNGSANYFAWLRFRLYGANQSTVVASREFHGGGYAGNNNRACHRGGVTMKYVHSGLGTQNLYAELTGTTYDNNNITEFGGWNQDTGWNDKCTIAFWEMTT